MRSLLLGATVDFRIDLRRPRMLEVPLKDVKPFFKVCPLCHEKDAMDVKVEDHWGGLSQKSYISCRECGARWSLPTDLSGYVKTAQLVSAGKDGKGADLLQIEHPLGFWQRMALIGLKERQEKVVREREVIVKEIVKIRCPYCHKLYDESDNKCPNCGASR